MTLYFAYGSNMNRAAMARRCPARAPRAGDARRLPVLRRHRRLGLGQACSPASSVHGVLWRLTARDIAALHAYELLHQGLYDVRHLPVRRGAQRRTAMIYLLRRRAPGKPKPGYVEMIAASARAWNLPERYIRSVERWSISRWTGARLIDAGELA